VHCCAHSCTAAHLIQVYPVPGCAQSARAQEAHGWVWVYGEAGSPCTAVSRRRVGQPCRV
jgi:hypothetical protein